MEPTRRRFAPAMLIWLAPALIAIVSFALRDEVRWLSNWPKTYVVPVGRWIDLLLTWFADTFSGIFTVVAWVLWQPLLGLRGLFGWLPWPVTIALITLIALYGGGRRLALLTLVSLTYIAVVGYWEQAMFTLSLVTVAVPISVVIGLFLGVFAFVFRPVRRVVEPMLDVMQAMPAFAYLVPMLMLFGLSPMVAICTSAIYAIPPMTRSVMLGFSRVPTEVVESAIMSGSTNRQILWWVRFPMSLPTLLLGLNQTIMAAFALVVFAAIVGGSLDIGYEVLLRLRKSQFGESFLAGIVITLFAILADRISRGYAHRRSHLMGQRGGKRGYKLELWGALVGAIVVIGLAQILPALRSYPEAWVIYPAEVLNDAVRWFTTNYFDAIEKIKTIALFFFLLPIKIGLQNSVRPHVWGFELTPTISYFYAGAIAILSVAAAWRWSWPSAVAVALLGGLYYFGTTGTPWPAFIAVLTLLGWQVGGWRIGLFSFVALAFMLLTGYWGGGDDVGVSLRSCGAGVFCGRWLVGDRRGTQRPRVCLYQTHQRHVTDNPAVRVSDPSADDLAAWRLLGVSRHYHVRDCARHPLHRAWHSKRPAGDPRSGSLFRHDPPPNVVPGRATPGTARDHAGAQSGGGVRARHADRDRTARHPGPGSEDLRGADAWRAR